MCPDHVFALISTLPYSTPGLVTPGLVIPNRDGGVGLTFLIFYIYKVLSLLIFLSSCVILSSGTEPVVTFLRFSMFRTGGRENLDKEPLISSRVPGSRGAWGR